MAAGGPQEIVDVVAGVPDINAYSFYATANSAAFTGNCYDLDGNTVATYSNTGLVATAVYTSLTLLGTITYSTNPAYTRNSAPSAGKFQFTDIKGFIIDPAISALLRFTTGNQIGTLATSSSPVAGPEVGRVPQGGLGANDSFNVVIPGTINATIVDPAGTSPGNITAADIASTTATNFLGQTVIKGTPTPGSSQQSNESGASTLRIQLSTANFNGTVVVEKSIDGGTTWRLDAGITVPNGTLPTAASFVFPGTAQDVLLRTDAGGTTQTRVRCTSFTSGTLAVKFQTGFGLAEIGLSNNYGQANKANSLPVVLASDQGSLTSPLVVTPTETTPTVANTTSVQILASNASRKTLFVYNGLTSPIAVSVAGHTLTSTGPLVGNLAFTIQGGQGFFWPSGSIVQGAITCYQASGGSTNSIYVCEGV